MSVQTWAPRSPHTMSTAPTRSVNPATAHFIAGFDAATRAATNSLRERRTRGTRDWRATRGHALLDWRTSHAHLGEDEQIAGLAEVRRGWDTAVALRRGARVL